jgi:hypothetical protein
MGLAVQDQRIDGPTDIVDGDNRDHLHAAGIGIDLDLADLRTSVTDGDRRPYSSESISQSGGSTSGIARVKATSPRAIENS